MNQYLNPLYCDNGIPSLHTKWAFKCQMQVLTISLFLISKQAH